MYENIENLLNEEISVEFNNLTNLKPGSDEHAKAVEDLTKLYKLRIEEIKTKCDCEDKAKRREMEIERNQYDIDYRNKDLRLKEEQNSIHVDEYQYGIVLDTLELIVPLIFYAYWMKKGFKFEETGSFTSTTFRGLINRFRPAK